MTHRSWRCASSASAARSRAVATPPVGLCGRLRIDRKSTRLNSSHSQISYAVFCLKKKKCRRSPRISVILQGHPVTAIDLPFYESILLEHELMEHFVRVLQGDAFTERLHRDVACTE